MKITNEPIHYPANYRNPRAPVFLKQFSLHHYSIIVTRIFTEVNIVKLYVHLILLMPFYAFTAIEG